MSSKSKPTVVPVFRSDALLPTFPSVPVKVKRKPTRKVTVNPSADIPPKKGDKIYVPSALYLSHGADDFAGGIATVSAVKKTRMGGKADFEITVEEKPHSGFYWSNLSQDQVRLKKEYGKQKAHADPDNSPSSNCG